MSQSATPPEDSECWLPVPGWEGLYEASDLGRIRSLDRRRSRGFHKGRVLKLSLTTTGNWIVHLKNIEVMRSVAVRDVIAATFLGPRPEGHEVRHLDGNRQNAAVSNLTYKAVYVDSTEADIAERWLPVVGYESIYEVSDMGRVRRVRLKRNGQPQYRVLKLTPDRVGPPQYHRVHLCREGVIWKASVHVLVARAFLGPSPEGHWVCHGPAGSLDNRLVNLSYGTPAKNLGPDKWRDGTMAAGVRNANAKLTDEVVAECRARVVAGESGEALAREFGVSGSTMQRAVKGEGWRHVSASPPPPRPTVPPYLQIAADLEAMITGGDLPAGSKLQSLSVLAGRYGVGIGTVFRAVEVLRSKGLVSAKGNAETIILLLQG